MVSGCKPCYVGIDAAEPLTVSLPGSAQKSCLHPLSRKLGYEGDAFEIDLYLNKTAFSGV